MEIKIGNIIKDKSGNNELIFSIDEEFVVLRRTLYRDNGEAMISTFHSVSKLELLEKINKQELRIFSNEEKEVGTLASSNA